LVSVAQFGVRKHRADYQIVLYMGMLMLLGLIVMYAIGPQRAHVLNNSYSTDFYTGTFFFIKQTGSLLLALAAFFLFSKIPYTLIQKYAWHLLVAAFAVSALLVLVGNIANMSIAQCSLGACRWFKIGPLGSIQPAEFLKFALLLFFAGFLAARARQGKINDIHQTLVPLGVLLLVAVIFVIGFQKDMGTGAAMIAIVVSMLFASGIDKRIGIIGLALVIAAGVLLILIAPHRMERMSTFLAGDTVSTTNAETYHIAHAKIAIGSGGLLGVGIGNSVQATGYLPEAINDSVFAVMGETFGFVGLVVILCLFAGLLLRILNVAAHLPDLGSRLIAVGVFGWLGAHVVLNVAAMTGLLPLTGITLPLLSFGGTSMVFIAGAIGLVFQLSRLTLHELPTKGDALYENSRSRRGVGRTRYAHRRSIG
jgi:cell division protein FtsW